jgi:hypothetical protein
MSLRNLLRRMLRMKEQTPQPSKNQRKDLYPVGPLRGKASLVLQSLLSIHESIEDSDAMQGYEGLPLQVEQIYWEVWGVLARNPSLTKPEEVVEQWMEDCVEGTDLDRRKLLDGHMGSDGRWRPATW